MENELNPTAVKYVMKIISNVIDSSPNGEFIYDYVMFDSLEQFRIPTSSQVKTVFEWLRRKSIIKYELCNMNIYNRKIEFSENSQVPYLVSVLDKRGFRALYRQILGNQINVIRSAPSTLTYDKELGIGLIDGKEFCVTRKNKRLFDKLVNRPKEWHTKSTILKTIDSTLLVKHSQSTIEINNAVTNLRKSTGMSTKQIELKSGNIRLNVELQINIPEL